MAETHGGYRQPSNPAPVSPPGALSQRTDGGAVEGMRQTPRRMPGMDYGQGGLLPQQKGAPLAGNPYQAPPSPMVGLDAQGTDLHLPMSHGLDVGPGAGSEVMPPSTVVVPQNQPSTVLRKIVMNDPSGTAGVILKMLLDRGL